MKTAIIIGVKDYDKLSDHRKYMIKRLAASMLPVTKEEMKESLSELLK